MKDLSNENVIHIKQNGIEYLQFRKLLEYPNLKHAFTLKPLNFAGISDYEEKKELVEQNNQKICKALKIDATNIYRPEQTHTGNVEVIEKQQPGIFTKDLKNIDALVTNQKEKILELAFADCMPLLFYDPTKKVIGNTHSGWKGTVAKIGKNTVEKMITCYGCHSSDIICSIGPTIRKCHFEVGEDVKNIFYETFKNEIDIEKYIVGADLGYGCPNKYYIDAVGINKQILLNMGLKEENIIDSKICSVCSEKQIHSYRAHGEQSGRNITIMQLI